MTMADDFERQELLSTSCWKMLFGGMVLGGALAAYVPYVVLAFVCTVLMFLASPFLGAWMARAYARARLEEQGSKRGTR
jgi:hypothetical protein